MVSNEHAGIEFWAGLECTVNRVGDRFFDQNVRSGHHDRPTDLDLIGSLGIKTLRYPVLWERVAPHSLDDPDWRWTDERLARLHTLQIEPIAGLLHHGSGPSYTSLIDPQFPEKLAAYAGKVAERYPWLEKYTPINEPLTTARFSGLYGHWYPHANDAHTFARMLLNQCKAVVLAMRAIRRIQPRAQLIQTDDLGKTHSTPQLRYQADFENERRWLAWDLLCGRLNPSSPMWKYLLDHCCIRVEELEWFRDNTCVPDIIGINHYLTSERFLDGRTTHYPPHTAGSNGVEAYSDVEAVRVLVHGTDGPESLLRQAWERFRLPLAVTEVHLCCSRGEQMRWLNEVTTAAQNLHEQGVEMRAVTLWAMFGAYDWNSLLTRDANYYEPGLFDLRSPQPRPTALASMAKSLATRGLFEHSILSTPGWWRRSERIIFRPATGAAKPAWNAKPIHRKAPVLITGAHGALGEAMVRACRLRGLHYMAASREKLDIADMERVMEVLRLTRPWAVVNAAGLIHLDEAELDEERCYRDNVLGPRNLAAACAEENIRLLTFSSDLVFDGNARSPYTESAPVNPINAYGISKVAAEKIVLNIMPQALVVRSSVFFGPSDAHNFLATLQHAARREEPFLVADDHVVSPTYLPDLTQASLDLMVDEERGIWHLTNEGEVTWSEFAQLGARALGLDVNLIPTPAAELGLIAPRPAYTALKSERAWIMPVLEDAIRRYARDCEIKGALAANGELGRLEVL